MQWPDDTAEQNDREVDGGPWGTLHLGSDQTAGNPGTGAGPGSGANPVPGNETLRRSHRASEKPHVTAFSWGTWEENHTALVLRAVGGVQVG